MEFVGRCFMASAISDTSKRRHDMPKRRGDATTRYVYPIFLRFGTLSCCSGASPSRALALSFGRFGALCHRFIALSLRFSVLSYRIPALSPRRYGVLDATEEIMDAMEHRKKAGTRKDDTLIRRDERITRYYDETMRRSEDAITQ